MGMSIEYLRTRKEVMETGTQEKVSTPLDHFFLPYARIVSIKLYDSQ